MAKSKKIKSKPSKEKEINMMDDNDIAENYENGGEMQCQHCACEYYITEGYSDEYCSEECYEADQAD